MKQTLNINIAGNVFTIDNDAYMLLNDYLDTLQHAFGRNDEGQELIIDIETRIAEIFAQLIEGGQNVITLKDVEAIIARIGRPEEMLEVSDEFDLNSGDEKVTIECHPVPPPYVPPVKVQKKLYRDPQGSMLGGVCMGLSWYTGIDVTWIRLITVALCLGPLFTFGNVFSSVFGVSIIYLILWIVVPEAKSPLQRMQMMGKAPTVDNIGRTVTDSFKESEGIQTPPEASANVESTLKKIADVAVHMFAILARVILVGLLIVGLPCVVALACGLLGALFALVMLSTSWGSVWWFEQMGSYWPFVGSPIIPLLCLIGWILVIGIPLFCLCWIIISRWVGGTIPKGWRYALAITWILSFILSGVTTGFIVAKGHLFIM